MQQKIINPLCVSKEIFELISIGPKISLHSLFNNSLNLKLDNIIVNISNNKHSLPPYGIVVMDKDFLDIKQALENKESQFYIRENSIYINKIKIDLQKPVQIYDCKMPKSPYLIRDHNIKSLAEKVTRSGKEDGFNIRSNQEERKFTSQLELLKDFFVSGQDIEVLKYFIGRGMGLTPAGDDFLLGMIGVFSLQESFKKSILEIRNFLLNNKGIYTNDISEQFLLMATDGRFSRSIILLLDALTTEKFQDEAADNILDYGATSGVDIILGIIFAYKITKGSDKNE